MVGMSPRSSYESPLGPVLRRSTAQRAAQHLLQRYARCIRQATLLQVRTVPRRAPLDRALTPSEHEARSTGVAVKVGTTGLVGPLALSTDERGEAVMATMVHGVRTAPAVTTRVKHVDAAPLPMPDQLGDGTVVLYGAPSLPARSLGSVWLGRPTAVALPRTGVVGPERRVRNP